MTVPRIYSALERSLFGVFAVLCLGAALVFGFIVATSIEPYNVPAWLAVLGGVALSAVSLKVVFTGTAWPFFEQRMPVRPPPPAQDDSGGSAA